jgi:hypothetical protein
MWKPRSAPGRIRGRPQNLANSVWKRPRSTEIVMPASSTQFTQASAAKMRCPRDPSQITCSRGPPRGFWDVEMRFTSALRTPMWRPQTLQGGFGEGHRPSQIVCVEASSVHQNRHPSFFHTSRQQVPRKCDVHALEAPRMAIPTV